MPEKRLEKCRESYQITNCKFCGVPTTNFDRGNICGGCLWKMKQLGLDGARLAYFFGK